MKFIRDLNVHVVER